MSMGIVLVALLMGLRYSMAIKGNREDLIRFRKSFRGVKTPEVFVETSGMTSLPSNSDVNCALCQFMVQKIIAETQVPLVNLNNFQKELETTSKAEASFLEIASQMRYPRSLYGKTLFYLTQRYWRPSSEDIPYRFQGDRGAYGQLHV